MPTALDYRVKDHDVLTGEAGHDYVLRVKDLPEQDKPREKLLELGPKSLSITELVAIIWGVGTRKEEVMRMAKRTMQEYGERSIFNEQDPRQLAEVADIPLNKAIQIIASLELGRRFYASHAGRPVHIRNAAHAYQYFKHMASSNKEQFRAIYLNSRYQLVHDELLTVGTLTSSIVHPREVFQPAIERGAAAVIVAHNHPSGVLTPTPADIAVTEQLIAAGKVLGIDLLDHLVVTTNKYFSVMECLKP